jgi:hypothetical protein
VCVAKVASRALVDILQRGNSAESTGIAVACSTSATSVSQVVTVVVIMMRSAVVHCSCYPVRLKCTTIYTQACCMISTHSQFAADACDRQCQMIASANVPPMNTSTPLHFGAFSLVLLNSAMPKGMHSESNKAFTIGSIVIQSV